MDDDLRERFKLVLNRVGMLQTSAELTGYSAEQIAKWRDGKSRPPFGPLAILCERAGVSLDWLAFGREPMEVGGVQSQPKSEDVDAIQVPFLDVQASAGPGIRPPQIETLAYMTFSRSLLRRFNVRPEDTHAISARGDSMLPTIADGQILLVDRSVRRVREDAIYVVSDDGDIRIKRIQRGLGGGLILKSDNPAYEAEQVTSDQAEKLKIEGRVFWGDRAL
jgi:phage repressor protein C with HTH and peptisase S24 domain